MLKYIFGLKFTRHIQIAITQLVKAIHSRKLCSICLDSDNTYITLECKNHFHFHCFSVWATIARKDECPNCRAVQLKVISILISKDFSVFNFYIK